MIESKLKQYTPEIVYSEDNIYALMLVELYKCPICLKYMFVSPNIPWNKRSFPNWFYIDVDAQLKRAGWEKRSDTKVDDEYICCTCDTKGLADFLCCLCGNRKTTDNKEESFGDPPEHLCTECYNTVPAREWDEKVRKLREQHRYDFE